MMVNEWKMGSNLRDVIRVSAGGRGEGGEKRGVRVNRVRVT